MIIAHLLFIGFTNKIWVDLLGHWLIVDTLGRPGVGTGNKIGQVFHSLTLFFYIMPLTVRSNFLPFIMSQTTPTSDTTSSVSLEKKSTHDDKIPTRTVELMDDTIPQAEPMDEVKPEESAEYISGVRLHAVLLGIALVAFLIMVDQTIIVTEFP